MARPKIELDPERVRELASQGLNERQIAHCLGVNWKTLAARKRECEQFMALLEQGKAQGIQQVASAMFQNAINGSFQAQQFYLCNRDRDNWRPPSKIVDDPTNENDRLAEILSEFIASMPD